MEDALRAVVTTTMRLCQERGIKAAEPHLAAYVACLLEVSKAFEAVSPRASLAAGLSMEQVMVVASLVAQQLTDPSRPDVAAAKLQIDMEAAYKQHRDRVTHEADERQERINALARAITDAKLPPGTSGHEQVADRVLEYVIVAGGLELAHQDPRAKEEVQAAVESVFPLSAVVRFITLPSDERGRQIESLAAIATGICLYNQALGKGGAALPPGGSGSYVPQVEALHKAAALAQWSTLRADTVNGLAAAQALDGEIQHLLLQVTDAVGNATAVPKELVLPCFERLGHLHQAMCEETRMLVVRQRMADLLASLEGGYVTLLHQHARARRPGRKSAFDLEQDARAAALRDHGTHAPKSLGFGVEWFSGRNLVPVDGEAEYSATGGLPANMALNGFDPLLLCTNGILERCQPILGYITFKQATYGFARADTMAKFAKGPGAALAGIQAAITHQPVLAAILGHSAAYPLLNLQRLVEIISQPLKIDFGCQTPTHFVERHIDNDYEWNEWVMRRRALTLASLRQKCTHSTQTGTSHFKRDAESQVWVPKAAAVQTRVNKGQGMPRKLQYVSGLRGAPATKMNVIRLELDLGQPHQF